MSAGSLGTGEDARAAGSDADLHPPARGFTIRRMLFGLAERLLPVLQLTRMALVFTAISNSFCCYLLSARRAAGEGSVLPFIDSRQMVLIALTSVGLYGFGMSLNDIIDHRRDRQLAAHRPLPSGRIALTTAHIICGTLIALAMLSAAAYSLTAHHRGPTHAAPWMSLALAGGTALLIAFYDLAGKYLVGAGLLTLGLIRFFHSLIPAPQIPLLWHPLLLFTHVAIVSTVCYLWEEKRPALSPIHWISVIGGVSLIVLSLVGITLFSHARYGQLDSPLPYPLVLPLTFVGVFLLIGWHIRRTSSTRRDAGQTLMLSGLLWLIVYDSAFVAGYVGLLYGAALLALLPIAYLAVLLMRWWSRLMLISQQPQFRRIPTALEASRNQRPPEP